MVQTPPKSNKFFLQYADWAISPIYMDQIEEVMNLVFMQESVECDISHLILKEILSTFLPHPPSDKIFCLAPPLRQIATYQTCFNNTVTCTR